MHYLKSGILVNRGQEIPRQVFVTFVPLLILSTRLQLQTLASYINEYKCEYEKKHDNSYQEEKHIDSVRSESYDREITKEKLINLKNELLFYTCNDIDIKLPKRKIKSL